MSRRIYFLSNRLRLAVSNFFALLAKHWKSNFYLYLAALFTVFAVLDSAVLHVTANMRQAAFDAMVRYRIVAPKPDSDIVIVDINEASLAAMAKDYGRWPWPRQVLGEFLEQIEKQQPKAVVFDILFSDADVYNPDSDAYFDAVIAATSNAFFPMLRLDPESDALSEVKPAMIPGVEALYPSARPDATVAVVLPHFPAALQSGRLGLHNIYPDPDGIARQYTVFGDNYGWKLPSLPARVGRELGWPEPVARDVLLNWRGKPFSYRYVSFSDVFTDMGSKEKKRPQDEFTNKIVIIGSTAPSLFDIEPTPMSQMHPGVEILATALDNFKHGDYLRFPDTPRIYLLLTLCLIWGTAWAFYRNTGRGRIDRLFGLSQFILIGISYASINFTNTYINLTGPVTIALAYFTVARIYAVATGKALERSMVRIAAERGGELSATLLLVRLDATHNVLTDAVLENIRLGLERLGKESKSVEVLMGSQRGLWGLLERTYAISWMTAAEDAAAAERVAKDVDVVIAGLSPLLRKYLVHADNAASWFVYRGRMSGGEAARAGWRVMFAEALLAWDRERGASL